MSVGLATLSRVEHSWRCQVAVSYQLVIDFTSPEPLAHFWAEALHYVIAPPPSGFDSWDDFFRSIGVPEDELGGGADIIEDPNGEGPRIWFQIVPEKKSIKNRIHIDVNASGGRGSSLDTRRERVEVEAARLVSLGATRLRTIVEEGLDHYGVAMTDPEGNEFDIN
jgi:Glyoxalase-like domain